MFPKVKEIECHFIKNLSFFKMNETHFQYLEKLVISMGNELLLSDFQKAILVRFLRLNPQLKTLRITTMNASLNADFIRDAVEYLQNVEYLHLYMTPATFIKDNDNIIHLKSVITFLINFFSFEWIDKIILSIFLWTAQPKAIEIISKFRMLKYFQLNFGEKYENFRKRLGYTWKGTYNFKSYN